MKQVIIAIDIAKKSSERRDILKVLLKFFTICCFILILFSCGNNEKVYKGIVQGIYDGSNQVQEMNNDDPTPEPGKEPPSYDRYERERQEMINDKNK